VIGAANCWIISLDNVSHLPDWLSDAICRLSTGGSFATRQRHTDEDEILFNVQRPCLVNGIEEIAVRGDLVDRAIVLELPSIPEDKRITDEEFWARFDEWEPGLFGYLLDAVAGALPRYESVKLTRLPRMADFAKWITAAEPALGWEDHFFVGAYTENRKQANDVTIEASPIARHVVALAATGSWEGTATALLERLNVKATDAERRSKTWPQASNGLSNALRRLAPSLRSKGVNVQFHRDQNVRTILVSSQSETSVAHDDLHDDVCSNDDPMTIFGAPDRLQ
jgi:hypothetical protein